MELPLIFSDASLCGVRNLLEWMHYYSNGRACLNQTDFALVDLTKKFCQTLSFSLEELYKKNEECKTFYFRPALLESLSNQEKVILPSPNCVISFNLYLELLFKQIPQEIFTASQKKGLSNFVKNKVADFKSFPHLVLTEIELNLNREIGLSISIASNGELLDSLIPETIKDLCHSITEKEKCSIFVEYLEFDIKNSDEELKPGVSIRLPLESSYPENMRLLLQVAKECFSSQPPNLFLERISDVYKALPEYQTIHMLGVMSSRGAYCMKIIMFNFDKKEVLPFLDRIMWKKDRLAIQIFLEEIQNIPCTIALAIDIHENIFYKIALELRAEEKYQEKILDLFVKKEWIAVETKSAIMRCEHLLWEPGGDYYIMNVAHLKVSFSEVGISAKVYISHYSSASWKPKLAIGQAHQIG